MMPADCRSADPRRGRDLYDIPVAINSDDFKSLRRTLADHSASARASMFDLMRLGMRMVTGRMMRGRPMGETFADWTHDIAIRKNTPAVRFPMGQMEIVEI